DASAEVIAQKLRQSGLLISTRSIARVIAEFGLQKKLYKCRPGAATPVDTYSSRRRRRLRPCDAATLQNGVRQALADRISGNLVGLWLLIPEHLRLGTWDLLCGWSRQAGAGVEPRLALQLAHEA